ncbi:MAG: CBS domain-containing protein [candidate division Zixibacteria bacterium]|nr:CBS domain-containing protein [candidate division Zixibacteria bacterium]
MLVKTWLLQKQREIMTTTPGTSLKSAMKHLIENKISCLPVLEDSGELIGIISDKDIFHAAYNDIDILGYGSVADLMTTNLLVGVPDDDFSYIAGLMTNNKVRHIPIMEKDRIVGLLSVGDIVKVQVADMEIENRYLMNYISGNYPG